MIRKILGYFLFITQMQLILLCFAIYAADETETRLKKSDLQATDRAGRGDTCVDCHLKLKGVLRSVVLVWERSVHAKKGEKCHLCHGGNPASADKKLAKSKEYGYIGRPKVEEITSLCGRSECHSEAFYQFVKSPHYQTAEGSGKLNCASCHGDHDVQMSSANIMTEKTCSDCHSVDYSKEIIDTVFRMESRLDDIQEKLDFLESKNTDIEILKKRHFKTRSIFHQLVHVFSPRDMDFTKSILDLEVDSLKSTLTKKIALVERLTLLYYLTIINVIIIAGGFSIYFLVGYFRRKEHS